MLDTHLSIVGICVLVFILIWHDRRITLFMQLFWMILFTIIASISGCEVVVKLYEMIHD